LLAVSKYMSDRVDLALARIDGFAEFTGDEEQLAIQRPLRDALRFEVAAVSSASRSTTSCPP